MWLIEGKMQWAKAERLRRVWHTRPSGGNEGQWNEWRAGEHVSQMIQSGE